MATTFNIDWADEFLNDPSKLHRLTEYGQPGKFRTKTAEAKASGVKSGEEFAEILSQYPYRNCDRQWLNAFFKYAQTSYNYFFDTDGYQKVEHQRDLSPMLDTVSIEDLRVSISSIENNKVKQLLLVATCGVTLDLWLRTTSIKGNTLFTSGLTIYLSDVETSILTKCFNDRSTFEELVEMVDTSKKVRGERLTPLHQMLSKFKRTTEFDFTYGQIVRMWELSHYISHGFENIEQVSTRVEVCVDNALNHPNVWLDENRISEETYRKIDQSI